ncbi:MAG: response regulator [Chloroflexota bacterium]
MNDEYPKLIQGEKSPNEPRPDEADADAVNPRNTDSETLENGPASNPHMSLSENVSPINEDERSSPKRSLISRLSKGLTRKNQPDNPVEVISDSPSANEKKDGIPTERMEAAPSSSAVTDNKLTDRLPAAPSSSAVTDSNLTDRLPAAPSSSAVTDNNLTNRLPATPSNGAVTDNKLTDRLPSAPSGSAVTDTKLTDRLPTTPLSSAVTDSNVRDRLPAAPSSSAITDSNVTVNFPASSGSAIPDSNVINQAELRPPASNPNPSLEEDKPENNLLKSVQGRRQETERPWDLKESEPTEKVFPSPPPAKPDSNPTDRPNHWAERPTLAPAPKVPTPSANGPTQDDITRWKNVANKSEGIFPPKELPKTNVLTTILYVEDNPGNRILIQRILQPEGYKVIFAKNGAETLTVIKTAEFSLVLMDINLPDIDGFTLTSKLRDFPKFENIPIIALTANVMKGDMERSLEAGCDGYIQKPVDVDALPEQIKYYLQSKEV